MGCVWLPMQILIFDCGRPERLSSRGLEVLQSRNDVAGKQIHLDAKKQSVNAHVSGNVHFLVSVRDSKQGEDQFPDHAVLQWLNLATGATLRWRRGALRQGREA